jgi:hypothetical protein
LDPTTLVIAAYGYARDRGESRAEAFMKAVRAYCMQHPDFPVQAAGPEVARLLLAAARSEDAGAAQALPETDEMEYVEPA